MKRQVLVTGVAGVLQKKGVKWEPAKRKAAGGPALEEGEEGPGPALAGKARAALRLAGPGDGASGPPAKRARLAAGADKGKKAKANPFLASKPRPVRYADLGGLEGAVKSVRELVERPLRHPEVYSWLGVTAPRGVLLHGPPGCGKTMLGHAIANETGVPFFYVAAPEIVSGMSGESETKIRQLFAAAQQVAPAIVFIDEIDSIAPKRESAQKEMEKRIVAQLLTSIDGVGGREEGRGGAAGGRGLPTAEEAVASSSKHIIVLGATTRPEVIDPALRTAGRFDREIALTVPGEEARAAILRILTRNLRLKDEIHVEALAKRTPGYVGADLQALIKEAAAEAVARAFLDLEASAAPPPDAPAANGGAGGASEASEASDEGRGKPRALPPEVLETIRIVHSDFDAALGRVQPSMKREGFATVPDVTWDDVGALHAVREELRFAITEPIKDPERFKALGINTGSGVLLHGPPGCGKTLVAKAIANESRANFISIKGPELLNKYVGESERAVRQLFARARQAAPCVLFFDELDALAPKRGGEGGNQSTERVVNQMLTEMDGVEGRDGVYLIAATNRPDILDPALLRPGRLDKMLFVPLPSPGDRGAIVRALMRRTKVAAGADPPAVVATDACTGYSGADCAAFMREAAVCALKNGRAAIAQEDLLAAREKVRPSVSRADEETYNALGHNLRQSRGVGKGRKPKLERKKSGG